MNASLPAGILGAAVPTVYTQRFHETLKDATQAGREWSFDSTEGQFKVTKGELQVATSALSTLNVYAHELGHFVGLNEHYVDVLDNLISCVTYPAGSLMDCPDSDTSPTSHDSSDASTRYSTFPWGPGAVWLTSDTGTQVTIKWADINDNESSYEVYRTTAPGIVGQVLIGTPGRDAESLTATGLTPGQQYCFHLKVYLGASSGYSSQICRNTPPSAPTAPSAPVAYAGPNNYTADVYWTTYDSANTHEMVTVYGSGPQPVARYYLPYSGTGTKEKLITLGSGDHLAQTYYIYVSTCNAKWNPYNPSNSCTTNATYASIYLSN